MLKNPKLFTVHINPDLESPYEKAEFVAEGFNIFAFIFTGLWMLYNRIWLFGIATIILLGFVGMLEDGLGFAAISVGIIRLGIQAIIGFEANELKRKSLEKRGYIISDIVMGRTLLDAQQRYFDRYFPNQVFNSETNNNLPVKI